MDKIASHARAIVISRLSLGNDLHDEKKCKTCSNQSIEVKTRFLREIKLIEAQELENHLNQKREYEI